MYIVEKNPWNDLYQNIIVSHQKGDFLYFEMLFIFSTFLMNIYYFAISNNNIY